jgi:hypothetical protein
MKSPSPVTILLLLLLAAGASAQPVVTPTPDRPEEMKNAGDYTVSNSFEAGYRLADIAGNRDVYRSAVNFGNGIRLFEGQLRIHSREGNGSLFDEFSFHTLGQGEDPYRATTLRAEKNAWYRYDMQVRAVNYFNRLPSLWQGEHGVDSERTFQNHELLLLPGRRFEIVLGYDRNSVTGPGFSSEAIAANSGGLVRGRFLRLTTDLHQLNNQYRAGVNFRVAGLAVSFLQGFDNYREDTLYGDGSRLPSSASNVQAVEGLTRNEPIHGNTPFTSVVVRTEKEHRLGFQGRYSYASGNRNGILSEAVSSVNPANNTSSLRQTFITGLAHRKQGSGDFTVTFLPSAKWTITNTTAANNTRIRGQSAFVEATVFTNQYVSFEQLGIRFLSNATEANYRPLREIGLYGAYRFSSRRIRTDSTVVFPDFDFREPLLESRNEVHSGAAGFRWLPANGVRVTLDAEVGRADQPLAALSSRKFHTEKARIQWRRGGLILSTNVQNALNYNPISLVDHSSRSRTIGGNGSWSAPGGRLTVDGGYTFLDLTTRSGIVNFFDLTPAAAASYSFYESNLHLVNFGARVEAHPRVTLYLGYNLAKDTGDDRNRFSSASSPDRNYSNFFVDGSNFSNSFPLTYQAPLARLAVKIHERISWNLGWQFYNYSERATSLQNYHAHVGYSSFRWSF